MKTIRVICALLITLSCCALNRAQTADDTLAQVDELRIVVQRFAFEGNTVFTDEELAALLSPMIGNEVTIIDLQLAAMTVSMHYRNHGYMLAEAILPEQEVLDGTILIRVFEGKYDQIVIHNESRLRNATAREFLKPLTTDSVIAAPLLEQTMLRFSELPGIHVASDFSPGSRLGTANLEVTLKDVDTSRGQVSWESNLLASPMKFPMTISTNMDNLSGRGDQLTLSLTISSASSNGYRFEYAWPFTRDVTITTGVNFNKQSVGGVFAPLGIKSWTRGLSLAGK